MAAAVSQVTQIPLLNIQQHYFNTAEVTANGANTIAHGMTLADGTTGIAPTVFIVTHNDATAVISAVSATATNILYTSTTTGTCQIFAF